MTSEQKLDNLHKIKTEFIKKLKGLSVGEVDFILRLLRTELENVAIVI